MASKSDRLNDEEYFRSKKNVLSVRRVDDYDGQRVWWRDEFGEGSCIRSVFMSWMSDEPANATPEEIAAIDTTKQKKIDDRDAIQKMVADMRDEYRTKNRCIDLKLVEADWAKKLIDYMTDEEFKHLVTAIGESERIVEP